MLLLGALHPGMLTAGNSIPSEGIGEGLVFVGGKRHIPIRSASKTEGKGESAVQITFTRRGGFAGPAVAIEGSVTFYGESERGHL